MSDKYNKYNASKTRRCSNNDCHNNWNNNNATSSYAWVFNLLAVTLLIQHVACVAQASAHVSVASTTTTTVVPTTMATSKSPLSEHFTPTVVLVKRHADNGSSSNNKKHHALHAGVEFGSRATSRHLSSIEAVGPSSASSNAGADGVNFAAYVNDFNMQAEAAIPEDILDQQHIQDVDAIDADSNMQYFGEGEVDTYAAVEPEADIILAAQKFSTSGSSRAEEEEYSGHNNSNRSNQNKPTDKKSEHFRKNSRTQNKRLKSDADNGSDNSNNKYHNGNPTEYPDQMDELNGLDLTDEEPLALPSAQEENRFQLTRDLKEQQNPKLIADFKGAEEKGDEDVAGQHMRFIGNFVGEKFNKAVGRTANTDDTIKDNKYSSYDGDAGVAAAVDEHSHRRNNKGSNLSKQVNNKSEMEYTDGNQLEETAIGDIEDKFRNEDENALQQQQPHPEEYTNADTQRESSGQRERLAPLSMGNKDDKDDRQSEKFAAKKIKRYEKAQSARFHYADDDDSKNNKNHHRNNNSKNMYKRHHYGELHEEIESAKSESAEKVAMPRNQQQPEQTHLPENTRHIDEVADSNGSSSGDEAALQADYAITYFGVLANSSKEREMALEEDQAGMKKRQPSAFENVAKTADNVSKIADSDDAAKDEEVHATRNQQQQQQRHELPDEIYDAGEYYSPHFSAFERYKAQRRNSRRNGHKMYKKKYKDYLSYAPLSLSTARAMTISIEATTTAAPGVPTSLSIVGNATATSAEHTISSTHTKLANSSHTDYYRKQEQQLELEQQQEQEEGHQQNSAATSVKAQKHAEKLRKYARKIEAEKSRGLPASPIFVVGNRSGDSNGRRRGGANPFYEGQINYYLETRDEVDTDGTPATAAKDRQTDGSGDSRVNGDIVLGREREERLRAHGRSMERMIAADNNNWYRRVSPVLRNGIKVLSNEGKYQHGETTVSQKIVHKHQNDSHEQQQHATKQHQHQHQHAHHHQRNHYPKHHQHQQHHQHPHTHQHHDTHQHRRSSSNHHKHRQHGKHYQSADTQQLQEQHQPNLHQHKLAASALHPPSPHASATQAAVELGMVQTPIPPPSYTKQHQQQTEIDAASNGAQQLGHQITELEEFERYYAKWPHLARVQFQVYDEHYREAHPELYPEMKDGAGDEEQDADEDYDDDYETAAELEEAQSGHDEDANLPPYIKKYNRRNKQLLNLLEGTLPPPTRPPPAIMRSWSSSVLQPGPHASSRSAGGSGLSRVRIDDDYLKEKRKRYHNRDISSSSSTSSGISDSSNNNQREALNHYQDLFAQQRTAATFNSETVTKTPAVSANNEAVSVAKKVHSEPDVPSTRAKAAQSTNQLPDDDVSISTDTDIDAYAADDGNVDIWPKEIENKSNANELAGSEQMTWQIEKLTTPNPPHAPQTAVTPSAPKAAIFRLPAYPAITGTFIGKPRSRSAQFAPSGGSRGKLAFVAPAGGDLHGNRWSNIYGRVVGNAGSFGSGAESNGLGIAGNHHKSLSRISAYKPTVHKKLAATDALTATNTTAPPPFLWHEAADGIDGNDLATTSIAATITPSGDGSVDDYGAESGVASTGVGRTISSFVYHRVIDASPRLVGTGTTTGRKQRLPFVAITDRRLETTKKAQLERQKDFEQNHYPMP